MNLRPFHLPKSPLKAPAFAPWKPYRALVLVLVFHLLGTTWGRSWGWGGAHLDLPLCCAVCLALLGGWEVGAWAGMIAGVLLMWTAWQFPGSLLVSRLLPPLVVGVVAARFPPLHPLVPVVAGALAAVLADCTFALLSPRAMPLGFWLEHAPRFALVQAAAMWPVMACVARLARTRRRLLFS